MIRAGPCERGVIVSTAPVEDVCPRYSKPWVLAATILGSSMVSIDGTALSIALPVIQTDLAVPLSTVLWVVNAYSLGLAALMLLGGSAGDRYGRRRVFVIGIVLFTAMSLICGLSASAPQLIAGRALQRSGVRFWSLPTLRSSARFSTNASAAKRSEPGPRSRPSPGSWPRTWWLAGRYDLVARGLFSKSANRPRHAVHHLAVHAGNAQSRGRRRAGLARRSPGAGRAGTLALGLTEAGNAGWSDPVVVAALISAFCLLIGFIGTESLRTSPMVPLGLFRSRNFSGANLLTLFLYAALAESSSSCRST